MTCVNPVLDFISRRFDIDCRWTTGNCYYFAVILKARFPCGVIFYDVIYGHFIVQIGGLYYDHNGIVDLTDRFLVEWENFDAYDSNQKRRILIDCIS